MSFELKMLYFSYINDISIPKYFRFFMNNIYLKIFKTI